MTITSKQAELFTKLFELTGTCNSIWVAGGAVVDLDQASDIDVWFGKSQTDAAEAFVAKLKYGTPGGGNYDGSQFQMLADCYWTEGDFMVQVMVVEDKIAIDNMDSFDISTHRWAYTSKGVLVKGNEATEPVEPPRVLKANHKTLSRYTKICKRYGHKPDPTEIKKCIPKPSVEPDDGMKICGCQSCSKHVNAWKAWQKMQADV